MMHEERLRREKRRNLFFGGLTVFMVIVFVLNNIRYATSRMPPQPPQPPPPSIHKKRLRGSSFIGPNTQPFVSNAMIMTGTMFLVND